MPRRRLLRPRSSALTPPAARRGDAGAAHADYLAWSDAPPQPGNVNLGEIMVWLRDHLPADAILCNGAGNYSAWIHRFYRFRRFGTQMAPISASMGYGVPAAVAMKPLYPERNVVGIAGDGDFLMNGPGIRHRRAIRSADHRAGVRQWNLRHHPHASGARISRPRSATDLVIRISPPMPAPSAASAPRWRRPRTSPPPSRQARFGQTRHHPSQD